MKVYLAIKTVVYEHETILAVCESFDVALSKLQEFIKEEKIFDNDIDQYIDVRNFTSISEQSVVYKKGLDIKLRIEEHEVITNE